MPETTPRWRVVIVDDHPIVRAGLQMVLSDSAELEVVGTAAGAAEAIEVCSRLQPDVVLLDIRLPDRSGTEVCRELKLQLPAIKVLFLTSYGDDASVISGMAAGGDGYLLKSIQGDDIAGAILRVAAGDCFLDPAVTRAVVARATASPEVTIGETRLERSEFRLVEMVAEGLLNKEIADRLGIAEKTVRNQMTGLFAKIGVTRRTEIAAWLASRRDPAMEHPASPADSPPDAT